MLSLIFVLSKYIEISHFSFTSSTASLTNFLNAFFFYYRFLFHFRKVFSFVVDYALLNTWCKSNQVYLISVKAP